MINGQNEKRCSEGGSKDTDKEGWKRLIGNEGKDEPEEGGTVNIVY